MLIIVMGALLNILLGLILTITVLLQSPHYSSTTIESVEDSASQYGFQAGDSISSVNGYSILTDKDLGFAYAINFASNGNAPMDIVVNRAGKNITLNGIKLEKEQDENGKKTLKKLFSLKKIEKNFGTVITQSAKYTVSIVRTVWQSLKLLLTGKLSLSAMSGPVGIISGVSQTAAEGLQKGIGVAINNIVNMMAMISINLGVFNLLPFPALDGGRFVFLLIEAIRRKPFDPKYEGVVHTVGIIIVFALILVFTFSDVFKLVFGGK
jgi:regulator of sigma E protease